MTQMNADFADQKRRTLRFNSIDQAVAEMETLAEAERAGKLQRVGNWTLGQALGHLATWAEFSFAPCPIRAPWFVRAFMAMKRKSYIYGPMKPGVRIPRVEGGTLGIEPMSLEEGLERARRAFLKLKEGPPTHPSPVFGMMSQDEAMNMNLRHAELHLGFFVAT
jgi:hypothetical protein